MISILVLASALFFIIPFLLLVILLIMVCAPVIWIVEKIEDRKNSKILNSNINRKENSKYE